MVMFLTPPWLAGRSWVPPLLAVGGGGTVITVMTRWLTATRPSYGPPHTVGRGGGHQPHALRGVAPVWGPWSQAIVSRVYLVGQIVYPGLCYGVPCCCCCCVSWRQVHGDHTVEVRLARPTGWLRSGGAVQGTWQGLSLDSRGGTTWPSRRRDAQGHGARGPGAHGDCSTGTCGRSTSTGLALHTARAVAGVSHAVRPHAALLGRHAAVRRAARAVHGHVGAVHVGRHGGGRGGGGGRVHPTHLIAGVEGGGGGGHVWPGVRRLGVHVGVVAVVAVGHVAVHGAVHLPRTQRGRARPGGVAGHEAASQRVLVLLHQGLGLPPWSRTAIEIWSQISDVQERIFISNILQVFNQQPVLMFQYLYQHFYAVTLQNSYERWEIYDSILPYL